VFWYGVGMEFDIVKNDSMVIRVEDTEYKGHRLVDVRVYFKPAGGDHFLPTRKGISIRRDLLGQVVDAMRQLQEGVETGEAG